jgi:hypothetical protein
MKGMALALVALLTGTSGLPIVQVGAAAQVQGDCQTQLDTLRSATQALAVSGKNADRDRDGLLRTLDSAATELAKGKNADAAKKLTDFRVKVEQLATAGRISSADSSSLTGLVDAAIACINGTTAA